ncbi:PAS domain S-box protein [Rhodobacteraceae bacterium 2376]|uniref:histidine kinase n=1 Tax=Rhabdonatronobacter sediminivivens TaxID=2743469 RepID=A0A7Z0I268_9RHOB|nr:PAS domain-containing sensor histidine kinase [Rhabdonatronobacter sediminivivens]NYS26580.1 PAS domain S-box protein [Rhabdonatronobacter sediminivivens]
MVSAKSDAPIREAASALELPFFRFDADALRIRDVNHAMSSALGYSTDALQAMTLEELLRPEEASAFRSAIDGLGDRFTDVGLWQLRRHSGEWWQVEIRMRSPGGEGEPGVVAIVQDASRLLALQRAHDKLARRLHERETTLRLARHQLGVGIGKMEIDSGRMVWSDSADDIHGVTSEDSANDLDDYLGTIHPDDRAAMLAACEAFHASGAPHLEMSYRIMRPDGDTIHVRGVAVEEQRGDHAWLSGVFQDITDEVRAREEISEALQIRRIAARLARMGSWRVDLDPLRMVWSRETTAIHELPEGSTPSVEEGINYYAPEYRKKISSLFHACAKAGIAYDEVLQIVTAKGNRVWVRTIGEAVRDEAGAIVAVQGAFQDISELVAARTDAEDLSRRLHQTLDSISDGFILLDHDWRFLFVNAQAERIVGRSRVELLGRNNWEVFPEAIGTIVQREYERALESGEPVRFRVFFPPLATMFEIDAEPTPEGLAVYFRDVTQEQAREERLRLLEAAVSRQGDILLITEATPIDDPDGPKIVYVNEAFVKRTGYSREEAIGATPRILQGPKTDRAELDRIRRALEKWRPVRAELINYTRSGEEFWLELDIVPLADETGWYTHFVSVERDITERKRAEEESRLNQERFRLVTQATNDVIWDFDVVADRQWWNENLQKLFGHDPAQIEPGLDSWKNRLHPDDRDAAVASVDTLIAGSDDFWSGEYRFRHAEGHYLTVFDRSFVIRDAEGTAIRMLGSMIDVTSQREMENRLRQSQKLEAVGQLTGGVAHDFNNLLTVILGNAELLASELGDQAQLRALAEMTATAAERGAELTNRLLAFSRKQALDPRVLDVSGQVQSMEDLLRRALPESIDIRIVRAAGLWQAEIDASQLEAALLNLALNARDAMPDGGHLTIEMANAALDDDYVTTEPGLAPGQYVKISVTDTGEGMAPEVLDHVFEPFFTTKEVGKGSGLGLSMVHGFVKQSRGHVRVYSEPGEGTCVKLYFPRSDGMDAQPESDSAGSQIVGGGESILVVEDDPMVREHLVASLIGLGYKVEAAETGPQALELLQDLPGLDLLFTDIVLPGGMSGRNLADEARALRPTLKVLFTSGYSENAIAHHGRLDPGVELLSKPYRREQLATKVRKVLDNG